MERAKLGRTDIEISKLGIGTGTAHPSGCCAQALMDTHTLSRLLLFAFDQGINFWDTAFQYETYPHIREALKQVNRSDIVLTTKLTTASEKSTIEDFDCSLKALNIDYFDICLLHGVRTDNEFQKRLNALDALVKLKDQGKIRAIGFSSHGLSALRYGLELPEIDVVWARINPAGLNMDSERLGLYDQLASIPVLKKSVKKLIPKRIRSYMRPQPEAKPLAEKNRTKVEDVLRRTHSRSKGVVGMKVLAEGHLRENVKEAIHYVKNLPFINALIIGMVTEKEIQENCALMETE